MKWKDLSAGQLSTLAVNIRDQAGDLRSERRQLIDEYGFDLVSALLALARRIEREAKRRSANVADP